MVSERQYQQPGEFDHVLVTFELAGEAIAWRAEYLIEAAKIQNFLSESLLIQNCARPPTR